MTNRSTGVPSATTQPATAPTVPGVPPPPAFVPFFAGPPPPGAHTHFFGGSAIAVCPAAHAPEPPTKPPSATLSPTNKHTASTPKSGKSPKDKPAPPAFTGTVTVRHPQRPDTLVVLPPGKVRYVPLSAVPRLQALAEAGAAGNGTPADERGAPMLCPHYASATAKALTRAMAHASGDLCPSGNACGCVHGDPRGASELSPHDAGAALSGAYARCDEARVGSETIELAWPDAPHDGTPGAVEHVPVTEVLVTRVLQCKRRPLRHCSHFTAHGYCERGARCCFAHALSAARRLSRVPEPPAPVGWMLGDAADGPARAAAVDEDVFPPAESCQSIHDSVPAPPKQPPQLQQPQPQPQHQPQHQLQPQPQPQPQCQPQPQPFVFAAAPPTAPGGHPGPQLYPMMPLVAMPPPPPQHQPQQVPLLFFA
uniref:C3H1-type domain-containing protein n=1 Tax=Neobodo designis TaxID=312471 RepID=A0A7S1W6Z6_NEODS|mmetsp:Transcript_5463/g.17226  ORF Transcript_5463/g.17226 Transcript_5463/m.17226 type:complete len:424 (+) Transcript_5463:865-2136(+)|eukprot:CAMPEP_0174850270 /NCGR_PEP_ID=MMETSP1114-20130205/19132_1 /TAXON_ID=312471 /ORGANISM="Neobodo designis, Strain CCAP 1951/1" /LENGTH=423 /DNA_ID=CAMNT_0016084717 /DNA_START=865 /DNA_END=2136 /DNA_ORIENTATION=+